MTPQSFSIDGTPLRRSDEERLLIQRAQHGDAIAFRRIVERHQKHLYHLALSMTHDPDDAMDIVQETFIRAHRRLGSFSGKSSLFTWLFRIARNAELDVLRRQRLFVQWSAWSDSIGNDATTPIVNSTPQRAVLQSELSKEIERALGGLSESHRAILMLREIDGLTYEELAVLMRVPKGTVMSRLFHARQKLRTALAGYLSDDTLVPASVG